MPSKPPSDAQGEFEVELLPKQIAFVNSTKPFAIYSGGWGAGKSISLSTLAIKLALDFPAIEILACAETAPQVRDTLYAEFMRVCPKSWISSYRENPSRDVLFLPKRGLQSKVLFRAFDDEWKARSFTVGAVLVEELTTLQYETYLQLIGRLRQAGMPCYFRGVTNPGPLENWVYPEFIADAAKVGKEDLDVFQTVTFDNYTLPKQYLANVRRLEKTNPQYFERNVMGKWGSVEGLIFQLDEKYKCKAPFEFDEIICGLDFGFDHPTAFSINGVASRRYATIDEYAQRGLTSLDIRRKAAELHKQYNFSVIYCDGARPEIIQELVNDGLPAVAAMKGPGSVFAGILFLQGIMKNGDYFIDPEMCPLHLREQSTYVWDKSVNGKEAPVKLKDDLQDARRYAIYSHAQSAPDFVPIDDALDIARLIS